MNPEQIKRLNERRQNLWQQMTDLLTAADGENRGLTAEESRRYDALEADLDKAGKDLERAQRHAEREASFAETRIGAVRHLLPGGDIVEDRAARVAVSTTEEYREAFRAYMRSTERGQDLKPEQRRLLVQGREERALGVASGSVGGYTIPQGFYDQIQVARKQFGGMRQSRTFKFETETGNPLPVPTTDDTGNVGALLTENTQVATQDVVFGQKTLNAYVYTSKLVLVSYQLLQDSAFDLEAFLGARFGERIGRAENAAFTTGSGVSQPTGLFTVAPVGKTGATGETTSLVYGDLIDTLHSVDPAYRMGAEWMMADSSLKVIRKLVDGNGRPLWSPGLIGPTGTVPETILDYPYIINQDAPAMAANATPIAFGDMSTYWIRDVVGMTVIRLDERYADYLQVGFMAFARLDGQWINAITGSQNSVALFKNSAT